MKYSFSSVFCIILASLMLFICLKVEYHNYLAGGVLPKLEQGKLRSTRITSEKVWKEVYIYRDPSIPKGRPLTKEENERMREDLFKARHVNELAFFTRTWALSQYLLSPFVFICSLALMFSKKNCWLGASLTLLSVLCIVLLLYRVYFND